MPDIVTHVTLATGKITALIVAKLTELAPALFGAFVSFRFVPSNASRVNRLFGFTSGAIIAHWWGHGLASFFKVDNFTETTLVFTFGIFGLTIVTHVGEQVPVWLKAIRVKYFGS